MRSNPVPLLLFAAVLIAPLAAQSQKAFLNVQPAPPFWPGLGRDPGHTANCTTGTQALNQILWQTPVDLAPQYTGTYLLIHYGSPLITAQGMVLVTVKTGASGGFQVESRRPTNGSLVWTQTTDYVMPPHNWTPSCGSTLTPTNRLATPAAGGTILLRANADDPNSAVTRLAFYGLATYQANQSTFDSQVTICTPITSDRQGNLYFGFRATGSLPIALTSGLARIAANGTGSWVSASTAAGDPSIRKIVYNCAPAISASGGSVYVIANSSNNSGGTGGYLLKRSVPVDLFPQTSHIESVSLFETSLPPLPVKAAPEAEERPRFEAAPAKKKFGGGKYDGKKFGRKKFGNKKFGPTRPGFDTPEGGAAPRKKFFKKRFGK